MIRQQRSEAGGTVTFKVHFRNGDKGRRRLRSGAQSTPPDAEPWRVPRISKLMALAIHFEDLIRSGVINDYADLARLGSVSRARISQIMDLLNLAPDVQDHILRLPPSDSGREMISERNVRNVLKSVDWNVQRAAWTALLADVSTIMQPGASTLEPSGTTRAERSMSEL